VEGQGRRVVAVLPIELQGVPEAHRWLGDSFQDAVATGLLRRGDLLVLDRLRVAEASAEAEGPNKVGALLGADFLLMGSLQASGERLRLSLRLIRATRGEVLDQIQFEGHLADTLALENDLGKQVPTLFGPSTLDPLPGQAPARLRHTRERYIVGMDQMLKASEEASRNAVAAFEDALRSEPDYAPAHAGLAGALGALAAQEAHLGKVRAQAHLDRALEEARTAVRMDASLPLAHQILGRMLVRLGDHAAGRKSLSRALELDPADFRALAALGDSFAYQDDEASHTQARSYLRRALELSPRYWWAHFRLAVLFQNEGDLTGAVFHADRARQLEPSADYAHLVAGLGLLWQGDLAEATRRVEEGLRQVPGSGLLLVTQALCDYARSDHAAFRSHARALSGRWATTHPVGVLLAGLEAGDRGQPGLMREDFLAFAQGNRSRASDSIPTQERRVLSVNAYHMARALAQGGQTAPARVLLDEAERMQGGKLKVAAQDPLLRSLP
jgi:TolB-like protein